MTPTKEQAEILAFAKANPATSFIIDAKAGTGKSSTLIELLRSTQGSTTIQAFNKSIATELQTKASASALPMEVMFELSITTVHAHGLSAFRKAGKKPRVEGGKMNFILKDLLAADGEDDFSSPINKNRAVIKNLAGYAKSTGFGLTSPFQSFPSIDDIDAWEKVVEHYNVEESIAGECSIDTLLSYAKRLLKLSNARENMIDFDDMIYLPLLWDLPLPTYQNVFLDEAQDINATRREMAFRSVKIGGKLIAVGDPNQAIYGFTGASVDSLSQIADRIAKTSSNGDCPVFPLSVCFRCAKSIITSAQIQVPGIYALPNAPEGQVLSMAFGDATANENIFDTIKPGAAILCRLNKPNVTMALELLKREKHCKIEGRDLGRKLLFYCQSSTDRYAMMPLDELEHELFAYRENQIDKLLKKDKQTAAALLADEIDCAILLLQRCIAKGERTYEQFKRFVEGLFADDIPASNIITLSSIHKAKGREWPTVYILGFGDYMPFFRATMEWELEQEDNLIYVAKTRAERVLVFLNEVKSWIDTKGDKA